MESQKHGIPINLDLHKKDLKFVLEQERFREIRRLQNECQRTLGWFDNEIGIEDIKLNIWRQKWWLRARTGGLYINMRKTKVIDKVCPLCVSEEEDLCHMLLRCPSNTFQVPEYIMRIRYNIMDWILSVDRSKEERQWISTFIQKRYDTRCEMMPKKDKIDNFVCVDGKDDNRDVMVDYFSFCDKNNS